MVSLLIALLTFATYSIQDALYSVRLPRADQPAELYSNQAGDDLRKTFVSAIGHAKESVVLVIYSLTDLKVMKALTEKSEEGVSVTVIQDEDATPEEAAKKLSSRIKLIRRHAKGLMHLKLLVIDGKQTWLGSANMTADSLKTHGNLVTAIESEPFAHFVKNKALSLNATERTAQVAFQRFSLANQTVEMWFLPDNQQAVERLLTLIHQAKKRIRIGMFTWTREDLADAVIAAKKRGLDVEVMMDHYAGKGANAKVVEKLCEAGVSLCFNTGNGLLHYKMMMIDDEILVNGSANWTKAAFTQNDDCFIVLRDLTPVQKHHLDKMWKVMRQESELQTGAIEKI